MMLAKAFTRPGRIEVTEGNEFQPMNLAIPMQHALEHQFRLAIRIDRPLRQILRDGHALRRPVSRASGTENELLHPGLDGGLQQLQTVANIVLEIFAGIGHGFTHQGVGGKVKNRFRTGGGNRLRETPIPAGLRENEFRAWIHR